MTTLLHYTHAGSASPAWIREMRAIESDCEPASPVQQPLPEFAPPLLQEAA